MASYRIKLKGRREIATDTMAFYFEKPEDFSYKAGQFGDFTLVNPPETDEEGNTRAFSLASAPYEDDLVVATRMRDTAFKRVLRTMSLGTEVALDAPFGSLTLHSDVSIPAVFLSGGIGITPVRSIVLQAAHDRLPHKIVLVDSNRRPEDSAFLDELAEAQRTTPNFTLVATMTDMEKSSRTWNGETGLITKALLMKSVDDLDHSIFYITGPRGMVAAMRAILENAEIKDEKIRIEEFSGY